MVKARDRQAANRPIYAAIGVSLDGEKTSWACALAPVPSPLRGTASSGTIEAAILTVEPSTRSAAIGPYLASGT